MNPPLMKIFNGFFTQFLSAIRTSRAHLISHTNENYLLHSMHCLIFIIIHRHRLPEEESSKDLRNVCQSSSSSFPELGLLRPVKGVTKLNPSIFSKVFLNFFSLLVRILESFLGSCQSSSCQHALSNFSCTDVWILLSVRFVILLKCLNFFLWSQRMYPADLLRKRISADINLLSSVLLTVHASLP
jgi:hypothetical protein